LTDILRFNGFIYICSTLKPLQAMENNLLNLFAGDIQIAHIAQTWIVLMLVVTLV